MLSFPLLPPQSDFHVHHFGETFRPLVDPPSASLDSAQILQNPHSQQQHRQLQQRRDEERKIHNAHSPLALLAADEAAIAQRNAAIRNFGAYWIRPPGVSKTLQAMTEEQLDLAEQEEIMRQEQGLRDLQAQQELEEARERAAAAAATAAENEGEATEERDLDEEIPEAEAESYEDVTFNDDSMLEGSQQEVFALEEAELTGAARDEEELGMENELEEEERDLDDSVPEVGSYQHTDSEVEDSFSDSELQDSFARPATGRSLRSSGGPEQAQQTPGLPTSFQTPDAQLGSTDLSSGAAREGPRGALQQRRRAQNGSGGLTEVQQPRTLSSSLLGSSFMDSSPVLRRAPVNRGAARSRGQGS